jgi:hypothetical protein
MDEYALSPRLVLAGVGQVCAGQKKWEKMEWGCTTTFSYFAQSLAGQLKTSPLSANRPVSLSQVRSTPRPHITELPDEAGVQKRNSPHNLAGESTALTRRVLFSASQTPPWQRDVREGVFLSLLNCQN